MTKSTPWQSEKGTPGLKSRINKDGEKVWAIRVGIKGKKIFESFGVGGRAKSNAISRIEDIREARHSKEPLPSYGNETFGAVAMEALPIFQLGIKNQKDQKTMATRVERICEQVGHLRLNEINANHLDKMRVFWIKTGYPNKKGVLTPLGEKTTELYSDIFSRILRFAVRGNLLKTNPVEKRDRFDKADPLTTRQPLGGEDLDLFREALPPGWFRDFVIALRYTGCRRNELIQLNWSHVDLEKRLLTILGSVRMRKRVKKKKSNRAVPILPQVAQILKRNKKRNTDFPFPNGSDIRRVCPSTVESDWANLRERIAGTFKLKDDQDRIKSYRIHDLRHGFAVECVERGMPLTALQKILGHDKLEQTSIYAAFDDKQTLDAFWKAFNP